MAKRKMSGSEILNVVLILIIAILLAVIVVGCNDKAPNSTKSTGIPLNFTASPAETQESITPSETISEETFVTETTAPAVTIPENTIPEETDPPVTVPPATVPTETEPPVTESPAPVSKSAITFLSWPTTTSRNLDATVEIKGAPNTEYTITVRYKSGPSTAKGLEAKTSDADGYVSWTWHVGGRTSTGTFTITVSGGGETETVDFTIV